MTATRNRVAFAQGRKGHTGAAFREVIDLQIPLDSNAIGKVIVEDIYSKNGAFLMKAGVELTKSLVERLQKYNIVQVDVSGDQEEAV